MTYTIYCQLSKKKKPLVAPLPPNQLYRLAPLPQLQVIFRRLLNAHPSQLWGTSLSVDPKLGKTFKVDCTFSVSSLSLLTLFVYGASPFALEALGHTSSTRALQLGIFRKEVFARLRPPRRSRCLAKGALQSLPPSHWHHFMSPARHCSL